MIAAACPEEPQRNGPRRDFPVLLPPKAVEPVAASFNSGSPIEAEWDYAGPLIRACSGRRVGYVEVMERVTVNGRVLALPRYQSSERAGIEGIGLATEPHPFLIASFSRTLFGDGRLVRVGPGDFQWERT